MNLRNGLLEYLENKLGKTGRQLSQEVIDDHKTSSLIAKSKKRNITNQGKSRVHLRTGVVWGNLPG